VSDFFTVSFTVGVDASVTHKDKLSVPDNVDLSFLIPDREWKAELICTNGFSEHMWCRSFQEGVDWIEWHKRTTI